jgi:hypothetical protein
MSDNRLDQPPVFDSRTDELPYDLTVFVDDESITFRQPMPDPFHNTMVHIKPKWHTRLRLLFGGETVVEVSVGATHDVIEAVCELDANYRGETGSARRAEADAKLHQALGEL